MAPALDDDDLKYYAAYWIIKAAGLDIEWPQEKFKEKRDEAVQQVKAWWEENKHQYPKKSILPNTKQPAWGEAVEGLQVSIQTEKQSFGLDEPIVVNWCIKNVGDADRAIVWHPLHYSPVLFEIGKKGQEKYIRDDSRRYEFGAVPAPPKKLVLKPGDVKEAAFDLRYFGLGRLSVLGQPGEYEVAGLYDPKAARMLERYLKSDELQGVVTERIISGVIELTLTKDLSWLRHQLKEGEFHQRITAAFRLAPLIGNETVLSELRKIYPPEDTRHLVFLVDCMAIMGDRSHIDEVIDMCESGAYAPYWKDNPYTIIGFLLKWGDERGIRLLSEYLAKNSDKTSRPGSSEYCSAGALLRHIAYFGEPDKKPDKKDRKNLPLLVFFLDDRNNVGSFTVGGKNYFIRRCDHAGITIQKILERDWGLKFELPEAERDEIIGRMRAELIEIYPLIPVAPPDEPAWGEVVNGLQVSIWVDKHTFRIHEWLPIHWRIENRTSLEDRTIFWHPRHYLPVVFEIRRKGEEGKKYLRINARILPTRIEPSSPTKLVLSEREAHEVLFDLRDFEFGRAGTYEIRGVYDPGSSLMPAHFLKNPQYADAVKDRIFSGAITINIIYPPDWSETDIAFKEAMNYDLSFGIGVGRTQPGAIRAWEKFLAVGGISEEQRLFALWRIASLCSYNLDPVDRKEKPDEARSERLFKQVRDLIPGLVCNETINAATQHASHWGTPMERAMRKAENYRWFRTRTDEMIEMSASRVSKFGSMLPQKYRTGRTLKPAVGSLEERRKRLRRMLKEGEESLVNHIAEFIEWSPDGLAVAVLLKSVEDIADPSHLETWRNTKSRFESEWETSNKTTETEDISREEVSGK